MEITIIQCIDCGKEKKIKTSALKKTPYKRCIVCKNIQAGNRLRIHGFANKERLYEIWTGINKRCNNQNSVAYKHYGGRGIKICLSWRKYINFRKWALISGYKNNLTIERKNTNGNYCPSNCCWIALGEQARNTRLVKLSWKIVKQIRQLYSMGNITQQQLANKFKVTKGHINNIIKGRTWNYFYHKNKH